MKKITLLYFFFILCVSQSSFAQLELENPSQVWIFGDSFSDTGNQKAVLGFFPPDPPYFDGRISDGPVWIEDVAEELGLTARASRYG